MFDLKARSYSLRAPPVNRGDSGRAAAPGGLTVTTCHLMSVGGCGRIRHVCGKAVQTLLGRGNLDHGQSLPARLKRTTGPMKRSLAIAAASFSLLGASTAQITPASTAAPALLANIKAGAPTRMVYELDAHAMIFIIPASGRASFTVDMKPDTYAIKSRVRTTGLADVFVNYDMSLNAEGKTRADGLKTTKYISQNKDGKKNRRVELSVTDTGFSMTAKPRFGNLGDPAATAEQVVLTNDPITALITFALEPRAPGADACGGPI